MLDDILDIVEIAVDIGEVVLESRKKKKERQEAEDEAQKKADRERPL